MVAVLVSQRGETYWEGQKLWEPSMSLKALEFEAIDD